MLVASILCLILGTVPGDGPFAAGKLPAGWEVLKRTDYPAPVVARVARSLAEPLDGLERIDLRTHGFKLQVNVASAPDDVVAGRVELAFNRLRGTAVTVCDVGIGPLGSSVTIRGQVAAASPVIVPASSSAMRSAPRGVKWRKS